MFVIFLFQCVKRRCKLNWSRSSEFAMLKKVIVPSNISKVDPQSAASLLHKLDGIMASVESGASKLVTAKMESKGR